MLQKTLAALITIAGNIPFFGGILRRFASKYQDGSVANIRSGYLAIAGYKWKRHHRYVNGYWMGNYELKMQKAIVGELKPGDVFYDIGANAGFFTLLAAHCVKKEGKVFAFEPLLCNIEAIKEVLDLNQLNNCHVVEKAVSDSCGRISFSEGEDVSRAHISDISETIKCRTFEVDMITLDKFVEQFPPPNLIKMDVEGAELLVLHGAKDLLAGPRRPKIIIEIHSGKLCFDIGSFLLNAKYNLFSLNREPLPFSSFEEKLSQPPSSFVPWQIMALPR